MKHGVRSPVAGGGGRGPQAVAMGSTAAAAPLSPRRARSPALPFPSGNSRPASERCPTGARSLGSASRVRQQHRAGFSAKRSMWP